MPEQVICPNCGETHKRPLPARQRENPEQCEHCNAEMNIVTLTAKVRIGVSDGQMLDQAIDSYHRIGSWFMDQYWAKIRHLDIREKTSGVCPLCRKQRKKLQFWVNDGMACLGCVAKTVFAGDEEKKLVAGARTAFPAIERKTLFQSAMRKAKELALRWLVENADIIADRKALARYLAEQKAKVAVLPSCGEEPEVTRIRAEWAASPVPQCLVEHFKWYIRGRKIGVRPAGSGRRYPMINKQHRGARIERLKKLNAAVGSRTKDQAIMDAHPLKKRRHPKRRTIPNVAHALIKPICAIDCPHLERYEWGWECGLHDGRKHPRPANFPRFPRTILNMQNQYKFVLPDSEAGEDAEREKEKPRAPQIELRLWEPDKKGRKGTRVYSEVLGSTWLERYGVEMLEGAIYADLWRREDVIPHEYYILNPVTRVIPVRQGDWMHIVVGLPTATCVLSISPEAEHVRYFRHAIIASWKEYFAAQRRRASRGYFRRRRLKEGRKIARLLHQETFQICRYLQDMPGRMILVQLDKKPYRREMLDRRRLNRALNSWPEHTFRQFQHYKSDLAGFAVNGAMLNLAEKARCPYCAQELGKSWQDLLVLDRREHIVCRCGKEYTLLLGLAKTVQKRMQDTARCSHCLSDSDKTWYEHIVRERARFVECLACGKTYKTLNAFAKFSSAESEKLSEEDAADIEQLFTF